MPKPLREATREVFVEGGPLSTQLAEYEPRAQQVEMAETIAAALSGGDRVVIEAATGTGKTLAYLVPALLARRRTIVSTATKNLQEQVLDKDIPLLRRVLPIDFEAVVLKGRSNYLCLWKWEAFAAEPKFRRKDDIHWWPAVQKWAARTNTGDRAEIAELPDDWPTWSDVSMSADGCIGRDCVAYTDCWVTRARRAAQDADLIVVNHHLFFADLAIRARTDAELLPPYDAIVFDEAHNLEETASSYFGLQVSNYRYADLLGDVSRQLDRENSLTADLIAASRSATDRYREFFGVVSRGIGPHEGRRPAEEVFDGEMGDEISEAHRELERRMTELGHAIEALPSAGEIGRRLVERIQELVEETATLIERDATDLVYVVERRGRGTFLNAYPIDLGPVFKDLLYGACRTQIFTSATLTTDGNFSFFSSRVGLPEETVTRKLEPVFDYMEQALLYVPEDLPDPTDPQFIDRVVPTMQRLVEICDGRAFLLFTSYRNMNEAFRQLGPKLKQPLLLQGQMSRSALLEEFRRDPRSVLFATASFWEGVDVQGDALSLVVIDKLPFASPGDPVLKARLDHIEQSGGNGFAHYQVPAAAIALKQGVGRLIRHRDDFGIIAILDGRLVRRGYGKRFLQSLPRARRSRDIDVVERWWRSRTAH